MDQTMLPHGGSALDRFRAGYGLALEWVVIGLMVLLALEVTAGVVFRTLGHSLVWYDEVASVLLAWLTFYGSALASVKRAHIGCPEVVEQLPPRLRRTMDILAQLLVIAFFVLLGWMGLKIMPALMGETLVSVTWVSMNFVQSVIPVSSALIVIGELIHLATLVREPLPRASAADAAAPSPLADGLH